MRTSEESLPVPTPATSGARRTLFVAIAVSVGLTLLPYWLYAKIAWPLMLFSTLAHEMGHGISALIAGGTFSSFEMSSNGAGVAHVATSGAFSDAFSCAGGLVGPAVAAMVFFYAARLPHTSRLALYALGIGCALADLLVVRNGFGFIYVGAVSLLSIVAARFSPLQVARGIVAFLAVQLSICVYTRSDYLFTQTAGSSPSDVAHMQSALLLPYWFWGGLCALFSAFVLIVGIYGLARKHY